MEAHKTSNYVKRNENDEYGITRETMKLVNISQKGTNTNLSESVPARRYKTKDEIINEQQDLEGHNTFQIFKQCLRSTAEDKTQVRKTRAIVSARKIV